MAARKKTNKLGTLPGNVKTHLAGHQKTFQFHLTTLSFRLETFCGAGKVSQVRDLRIQAVIAAWSFMCDGAKSNAGEAKPAMRRVSLAWMADYEYASIGRPGFNKSKEKLHGSTCKRLHRFYCYVCSASQRQKPHENHISTSSANLFPSGLATCILGPSSVQIQAKACTPTSSAHTALPH